MYRRITFIKGFENYCVTSDGRLFRRIPEKYKYVETYFGKIKILESSKWVKCELHPRTHCSKKIHTNYIDYATSLYYPYKDNFDTEKRYYATYAIHLLVAYTFFEFIENHADMNKAWFVHHKDGNTANNDISNLYIDNKKNIISHDITFPIKCNNTGKVFRNMNEIKNYYINLGYSESYISCNFYNAIRNNKKIFKQNFEMLRGK